jgi:heme/copper-type cytochrome/quinol oxidase subunit 1
MLSAKLFTVLAILLLGFALLEGRAARTHVDIAIHSTYFVVAHSHIAVLAALASVGFALIYFAAARWVQHPLNNSLGLVHFGLVTLGFVLTALAMYLIEPALVSSENWSRINTAAAKMSGESTPLLWPLLALNAGVVCFLLGCAVFAVNVAWTVIQISRSR